MKDSAAKKSTVLSGTMKLMTLISSHKWEIDSNIRTELEGGRWWWHVRLVCYGFAVQKLGSVDAERKQGWRMGWLEV